MQLEEFDHLERMYDSAESNIESRENFLTETIGLLTSISGGFKKIFIDFLATKNLEFQEFISERGPSKIEIYTQISYKNKYKGSNKPDIILHYANEDVVLIENKVDSNDIDNFLNYINELGKIKFKFLIIPQHNTKIKQKLKSKKISMENVLYWEEFYDLIKESRNLEVFSDIEKNYIQELQYLMYSFDIDNEVINIESSEFKKRLKRGIDFLKKIKDKGSSSLSIFQFVNNTSNQNYRIQRIIDYEIVPIKLYNSRSYELYCFLSLGEMSKLTFNIEIYGKSRRPKISVNDKLLFEHEIGSKSSFFRIPLLDNSTTSLIKKVQRLIPPIIKNNLKDNFFEILYKYSKAVEREPKFIEQFKDMVKVFQDVDHYYKKVHKKHLNKTEMNMILRKPRSYQLIIKLLAKK